jgi:uncharacterized membrane protein (UPF0127 family)
MRKVFSLTFFILFVISFFVYSQSQSIVRIGNNVFYAQVAQTSSERARGLMYRDFLAKDAAMLFVFDREEMHPFWMKNTKIPLDIIWISKEKKVVSIKSDFEPCTVLDCPVERPYAPAMYALEVNGGFAQKLGIRLGDKVDFL